MNEDIAVLKEKLAEKDRRYNELEVKMASEVSSIRMILDKIMVTKAIEKSLIKR